MAISTTPGTPYLIIMDCGRQYIGQSTDVQNILSHNNNYLELKLGYTINSAVLNSVILNTAHVSSIEVYTGN